MSAIARTEARAAYLFLLPALSAHVGFVLIPVFATLVFSFSTVDIMTGERSWVGFGNYLWIFSDQRFWRTFINTFTFVVLAAAGNVGLGLFLAAALNRAIAKPILYFLRLAYFLPVLAAPAFVSFVWKFLYSTDLGVFNYYLGQLDLPAVGWLTDGRIALLSVAIMDVWKHMGFYMMIFLAALQSVPREIIEAAHMDGASARAIFWKITVPFIAPVILFCVSYATITGLQVFDSIYILTAGGPGDATRSAVMYMYNQSFEAQDLGAGTAVAMIVLVVVAAASGFQHFLGRRWVTV